MAFSAYSIPETHKKEIDEFESLINNFKNNVISEAELKARRVPFGIYEQRKRGTYMVRIRCTAGIITPFQLKKVAEISLRFASGSLHITTRQEIQIHDVGIDDIISILRELAQNGLSTRGGGGNTVRNITAPWDSGITNNETFDITPYAVALTSELIFRSDSWLLPRKYKIAFSHSDNDFSYAQINDLGFIATIKNGIPGFRVFTAGGMGHQSQVGNLLHDFIETHEIFDVAEAIKRLFSKYGNRKNKHSARLRFLWNSLGKEKFEVLYNQEKKKILEENLSRPEITSILNSVTVPRGVDPLSDTSPEFKIWKNRFVIQQKQSGAYAVILPLLYGNISAEKIIVLATSLLPFGDNTIRFTCNQNITLRNIAPEYLGNVYRISQKISELSSSSPLFGNAVACAGASTCQLGICRSRGALGAIIDQLKSSRLDLDSIKDLRLNISGCSNSCGQHVIADLGFFGKAGRKDQHSYPAYTIVGGAISSSEGVKLAGKIDEVNAKDLPVLVEEILQHYISRKKDYVSFAAYLESEGIDFIREAAGRFREIPSFEENRNYYRDWGETEIFSLAGKGTGECSAGLFDLIEIDLNRLRQIRSSLINGKFDKAPLDMLYDLLLVSSRMLLITRGLEAASDKDVFQKFKTGFIDQNIVDLRFLPLIEKGITGAITDLIYDQALIVYLSQTVEQLYLNMDNSMQFSDPCSTGCCCQNKHNQVKEFYAALKKDFRGVACPMNFVKTKMALSQIKSGEILQIKLDDGEPVENVPKSVEEEGHSILSMVRRDDHWLIHIKKQFD
ncbi:MAG TPA: sulfurtransferase TusA family protein [Chitinispirillaceae bacterium]|nr:sulfurtransferase TusA family protein [Chitinispirillaceae bacterium]